MQLYLVRILYHLFCSPCRIPSFSIFCKALWRQGYLRKSSIQPHHSVAFCSCLQLLRTRFLEQKLRDRWGNSEKDEGHDDSLPIEAPTLMAVRPFNSLGKPLPPDSVLSSGEVVWRFLAPLLRQLDNSGIDVIVLKMLLFCNFEKLWNAFCGVE